MDTLSQGVIVMLIVVLVLTITVLGTRIRQLTEERNYYQLKCSDLRHQRSRLERMRANARLHEFDRLHDAIEPIFKPVPLDDPSNVGKVLSYYDPKESS